MASKSSKVLTISGSLLGIFVLVGLIYYRKKKNVRSSVYTQKSGQESPKEEATPERDDTGKKSIDNKPQRKLVFSDSDELIGYVLRDVLHYDFNSREDYLEKAATSFGLLCENYDWFDSFPKNSDELEDVLIRYGLKQEFDVQLYNNNNNKK